MKTGAICVVLVWQRPQRWPPYKVTGTSSSVLFLETEHSLSRAVKKNPRNLFVPLELEARGTTEVVLACNLNTKTMTLIHSSVCRFSFFAFIF